MTNEVTVFEEFFLSTATGILYRQQQKRILKALACNSNSKKVYYSFSQQFQLFRNIFSFLFSYIIYLFFRI